MLPSKISCRSLVHLAILWAVLLVHICEGQNWSSFQNKHIDYPESSAPNLNTYCDLMMKRRNLNPSRCKTRNTFVNEEAAVVKQVCVNEGTHYKSNLYDSIQSFKMVDCRNVGGTAPDSCRYVGTQQDARIRVACENNQPVHFEAVL
ncbi:ribonuclease pancreatic-like [Pogona vitticeps]